MPEKRNLTLFTGPKQEAEDRRVGKLRRQMNRIRDQYDRLLVRLFRDKASPEEIRQALATRDRLLEEKKSLIDD